jgi:hypothetical protein
VHTKKCRICQELKPLDGYYRAAGMADGYRSECKECNLAARARRYREEPGFQQRDIARVTRWRTEKPEKYAEQRRQWKASGRQAAAFRRWYLKKTYGLTTSDYDAMLGEQGGGCAICGVAEPEGQSLHVDHCHDSGTVRGLLCFRGNAGLGQFDHDATRMARAAAYLQSAR